MFGSMLKKFGRFWTMLDMNPAYLLCSSHVSGYHMVGVARTVAVDGDFLEVLAALRDAGPGEVIMIDTGMRGEPGELGSNANIKSSNQRLNG